MKKLFTSILMLSVALCSWGVSVKSFTGGVLTLESNGVSFSNFAGSQDDLSNSTWKGNVTRLVLIGDDFTNADFDDSKGGKMTNFIKACAGDGKKLYLDLEGCTGVISKVKYTGEGTEDYTSKHFEYDYSVQKTVNVSQQTVYVTTWNGNDYTVPDHAQYNWTSNGDGTYNWTGYIDGPGNNTYTVREETAWGYYDNGNFVPVPDESVDTSNQTATIDKVFPAFTLGVNDGGCKGSLSGITFPNHSYFTAIPDNLCYDSKCDLQNVVLSFEEGNNGKTDYITWIGKNAFRFDPAYTVQKETIDGVQVEIPGSFQATKASQLANVTLPKSLKVIGVDAFYGCTAFTSVDLSRPTALVRVDAAAFNMVREELNKLSSVTLPGTVEKANTSLRFFGNQVFSSSHITTLDFTYCEGITHFAYDGADSMGEKTYNPDGDGFSGTATFAWYGDLETLILPPNLLFVTGGDSDDTSFSSNCKNLTTVIFTGKANYDECELTNELTIGAYAFQNRHNLASVTLSNNVVEIGTYAFSETALESISIPASVEEIGTHAFDNVKTLKTVIFEDLDDKYKVGEYVEYEEGENPANLTSCRTKRTHLNKETFVQSDKVNDVYINSPAKLLCDNKAFDLESTHGHSDPKANIATLHFPEGQADYYTNTSHYLTDKIASDPGLFQKWLSDHLEVAQEHPAGFGWHEFVNAGPTTPTKTDEDGNPVGEPEIILRTFSDYNNAYIVPDGMRAYVVNDVIEKTVKNSDNKDVTYYEANLYRIRVIPKQTGVILYGHPNGKDQFDKPTLVMTTAHFAQVNDLLDSPDGINAGEYETVTVDGKTKYKVTKEQGLPLCRANWFNEDGTPKNYVKNFLEPTSSETGGKYLKPFENVDDEPTVVNNKKEVTFRNFGLGRYNKTQNLSKNYKLTDDDLNQNGNYEGFFRLIAGQYPTGKAYLHLAATEYADEDGAEVLVNKDETTSETHVVAVPYYYESKIGDQSSNNYYDARSADNAIYNTKGWWNATNGFDWNVASENYQGKGPRLNWGVRPGKFISNPRLAPKFYGEIEEGADGVAKLYIPAAADDGTIYNLQGVKVTNPTKGVYVRNGKKVVIK